MDGVDNLEENFLVIEDRLCDKSLEPPRQKHARGLDLSPLIDSSIYVTLIPVRHIDGYPFPIYVKVAVVIMMVKIMVMIKAQLSYHLAS